MNICASCGQEVKATEPRYLVVYAEKGGYLECYDVVLCYHVECLPTAIVADENLMRSKEDKEVAT